jgi:hypothetical protein
MSISDEPRSTCDQEGDKTMKLMLMTKPGLEPVPPPTPELMAAIGKLTEDMTKAGVLVSTGGL